MFASIRLFVITICIMCGFPITAIYSFDIGILYGDFGSMIFLIFFVEIIALTILLLNFVYVEEKTKIIISTKREEVAENELYI